MAEPCPALSVDDVARRARLLADQSRRTIIGIAGAPGAGKSTLAEELIRKLGSDAVLIPMDGFHLANDVLRRLGRRDRKGSPETFDASGYLALLHRLSDQVDEVVYAPAFRRDFEEPVAASIPVCRHVPIVITEGNYLLLSDQPWAQIRRLLSASWFLSLPDNVRRKRLIARHVSFGKAPAAARAWTLGTDQRNAELVAVTAARADLVFELKHSGVSAPS